MTFEEFNLNENLMEGLRMMNFKEATPVQAQTIPLILQEKDVISCAQTGTGKTAAFLLPLLNNLVDKNHPHDAVNALIMAPTRELAQQIDRQLEAFSYFLPVSSVAIYGGNDAFAWEQQKRGLTLGADVVVATPGRLISHLNLYDVDFSQVKYLVLDEADRMLDMGFYDDIMQIVNHLPKERQTVMFSATMPPKIRKLAKTILRNPLEVQIAIAKPADGISQQAYVCYENQKLAIIHALLSQKEQGKVIIFSRYKSKVRDLTRKFKQSGLSVSEMHSDLEQAQRDHVMREFKNGNVKILVATDILSRGIDIEDIDLIINFDVPNDVEDYVHRIGRTARASATGTAITLISKEDQAKFFRIEQFLEKIIEKIPLSEEMGEAPKYAPKQKTKPERDSRKKHKKNFKYKAKKQK